MMSAGYSILDHPLPDYSTCSSVHACTLASRFPCFLLHRIIALTQDAFRLYIARLYLLHTSSARRTPFLLARLPPHRH